MIKLVSFVVFISAFIWTWILFNTHDKIDSSIHAGIQSKLMILIENAVKASRPNSSDFEIVNIYTKKINDNQISAHFSYKFTEHLEEKENVHQAVAGEAILNRTPSENPSDQKWVVQSVKTDNNTIEFQDGLIITNEKDPVTATTPESGDKTTAPVPEEKKTE